MAEELLLLGALLDAANRSNESELEQDSLNWVVPCTKCDARMERMKGHQAYNTAPNSTILCDGCRDKVAGTKYMFHCPKNQNLFHLNGFDYCLKCGNKHRDKSAESIPYNTSYQSQESQSESASNTEIIDQKQRINRLRNELDELRRNNIRIRSDKDEIENRYRILENDKNQLFQEKCQLNTRMNDNLNLIDQQKEEIKNLKYMISSSSSSNNGDIERLQNDKLESQNKYRIIKQKLDDKLDLIEQYKEDINRLKNEKEEIINNYNQQINDLNNNNDNNNNQINDTPGKKNEISPTLKAIFTQKFFGDKESQQIAQKEYITKIHNEILGMAFASHATIEWMMKNCKIYDEEKNNQNNNNDVFSFNTFVNAMNDNNNNNNNNNNNIKENELKPIVNLKEFDLMTIQNLQKNLNILYGKYNQCITSTREWKVVIENILNPKKEKYFNKDINQWKYWNYNNIIDWIMGLDNGRFRKYQNILKIEMSKVALNGMALKNVQNADLLMYGIDNFQDQMRLVQHIDALTGRKQKIHANISSPVAYQQYPINPGAAPGAAEGMEGSNTADIK